MKLHQFESQWEQYIPLVANQWNRLSPDDIELIDGSVERLELLLRERYGFTPGRIEEELRNFARVCRGRVEQPFGVVRRRAHSRLVPTDQMGAPSLGACDLGREDGRIGYAVLWMMGAPAGLLFVLWLFLGNNIFGPG